MTQIDNKIRGIGRLQTFALEGAKSAGQISELGGSRGMAPGKFFFMMQIAANLGLFSFLSGLWGGACPPLEPPVISRH